MRRAADLPTWHTILAMAGWMKTYLALSTEDLGRLTVTNCRNEKMRGDHGRRREHRLVSLLSLIEVFCDYKKEVPSPSLPFC